MKKRVISLLLTAIMGMSLMACGTQEEIQEASTVSVSGILPETGDVIVTTTYIGTVEPKDSITVYPMVDGVITQMSATLGKEVKKGEALFTLDNTEANKAVTEAQEEYDVLKKAADQAKKDAEQAEKDTEAAKKEAASTTLTLIKTNVNSIIEDLENAEQNLENVEDELGELKPGEDGKYIIDKDRLRDWIGEATTNVQDVKTSLTDVGTDLQKIEVAETKLTILNKNLTDAQNKLKYTKTDLDSMKTNLTSNSMAEDKKKALKSDIKDAKDEIIEATTFVKNVQDNLPTTATAKTTTSTTTSGNSTENKTNNTTTTNSGTSLSTTVETAYDQQLLLAEKKLNEAKAQLELYQVTAPIDGTVEAVYVEQNEKAFEDEPCLVISNKSNIEVTFQVPEAVALVLKAGDKVQVEKNDVMTEASITEVGIMADVQTKLFTVKASLGAVTGFSTGTDVKVYADTQKATGVMKIPYDSLYFQSGNAYVYCVIEDEAVRRPVQVGLMNDEYAQILDGLTESDIVISTWSSQLKDGAEVNLLFVIGNSNTVDIPEDNTEEAPEQITDDSDPVDTENTEEEHKWELPDLD